MDAGGTVGPHDAGDLDRRDPAFIASLMPALERALRWFDPEVRGIDRLPEAGPALLVGNHSGGLFMPDHWALLHAWTTARGAEEPLYALGFDLMFSMPGVRRIVERLGCVPASQENAEALLERGATVLVYPGGDAEDYRPWSDRNRVDLRHHVGFVRLALRTGVPVIPVVDHGSHHCLLILARGDGAAHRLGLDRFRLHVLPVVAGPLGVSPLPLAGPPLPAKVIVQVGEPFDWSDLGPEAADDPETVERCYEQVENWMQSTLDDLVAEVPHPVGHRMRTMARAFAGAVGRDRSD